MWGGLGQRRALQPITALFRDTDGATAVEFALIALPFSLIVLIIIQMGIVYVSQSALDVGVVKTGDTLLNSFYAGGTPNLMTGSSLKASVANGAGAMITNDSTLAVEIRQLATLDAAVTPIVDVCHRLWDDYQASWCCGPRRRRPPSRRVSAI